MIWERAKRWLLDKRRPWYFHLGVAFHRDPDFLEMNPGLAKWLTERPGEPIPWTPRYPGEVQKPIIWFGYDPGSEKGDVSVESEWVKRPDEREGIVAKIDIFPCENLREMIHRLQVVGAIRADVASQLVAQLERDGLWANPYSHARQTVKSSAPSVTPDEIVDVLAWSCKRHGVEDVIPPKPPGDRSVKGEPTIYGKPDLEYSAIGDKSEPNGPTVRDGLIQEFEYRLAKLEHALGEERLARQLGEARTRSLIRADARMR